MKKCYTITITPNYFSPQKQLLQFKIIIKNKDNIIRLQTGIIYSNMYA